MLVYYILFVCHARLCTQSSIIQTPHCQGVSFRGARQLCLPIHLVTIPSRNEHGLPPTAAACRLNAVEIGDSQTKQLRRREPAGACGLTKFQSAVSLQFHQKIRTRSVRRIVNWRRPTMMIFVVLILLCVTFVVIKRTYTSVTSSNMFPIRL